MYSPEAVQSRAKRQQKKRSFCQELLAPEENLADERNVMRTDEVSKVPLYPPGVLTPVKQAGTACLRK
jgi:hypothetical protein